MNANSIIKRLLDQLDSAGVNMHGLLVMHGNRTIAEGYYAPFDENSMHRMYSVTKSFTSLAIGLLAGEGRISLDDHVHTYFPDKLPEKLHPYTRQATIRDLLRMATQNSATSYTPQDDDWVRTFFHMQPSHPPGTVFQYDTAGTTVLAALVEKISGEPLLGYLRPRLLDPIGFSPDARCIRTPEGHMWGGSGLICRLRDIAAVGRLCMQGGEWEGRQLVPAAYVREATSRQIDNEQTGSPGYGYQFWCLPHGGFQLFGMGGQYVFCYPDRDLLFACMADVQADGPRCCEVITQCVEELYQDFPELLKAEEYPVWLEGLKVKPVQGMMDSPCRQTVDGKWYTLEPNPMHIDAIQVTFSQHEGTFTYIKNGQTHAIRFGLGRLCGGTFPEVYFGNRIGFPAAKGYDILTSAAWVETSCLSVFVHVVDDYLGSLRIKLGFTGNEIAVHMIKAAEWFLDDYQGFAGGLLSK